MAIASMTKAFVVGPADQQEKTLHFLQKIGLMHIEPSAEMAVEFEKKNGILMNRVRKLDQLIKALDRFREVKEPAVLNLKEDDLALFADEKLSALQDIKSRMASLERLKNDLLPWGNFELDQIHALEAAGLFVRRYRMDEKKWADFSPPDNVLLGVVAEKQGVLFYTLSLGEPPDIPQASSVPLPEFSLEGVDEELKKLSTQADSINKELGAVAQIAEKLKQQLTATLNEASYVSNMGTLYRDPHIFGLQGWLPQEQETTFQEKITNSGLPLQVVMREPLHEEEPPILLKNNWLIERIEPLLKLYKLPKYRELDPSYFFAPFMILFFGLCLGDVGYGVLFYLISVFIDKKLGDKIEGLSLVMRLCKAFSVAAIVIGVITGSLFGYNFESRGWIILDVAPGLGDPMLFFYLSLAMGIIHLSVCYLIAAFQASTSGLKLQKLGLLGVLWGGNALIVRSIWFTEPAALLNPVLYYFGVACLALGLLLTLLFATDNKNWGIRIGLGLWNVYGLTGMIADLLSYARLFGLGIATGAIAAVMNMLAVMVFEAAGPVIGGIIGFVVIIIGHTFNLLLSILGSTVHSARLHFVEAFKIFFEGGGVEYKPFKVEKG